MEAKTISLRVSSAEAARIERLAAILGLTQSDVLKQGLAVLEERLAQERTSYEIGADLFGRHGSGRTDGSVRRKQLYRESVRAKRARR
jgi:hypothetical protein